MFQTYEPVSDRGFAERHLPLLREKLKEAGLDGFIIPHDDEYQNEYIPAYAERLLWASGFSGSAGAAIVMIDRAVIFTDGRYTLQVRQQVDDRYFAFEDSGETTLADWIAAHAPKAARIGYDPMLHSPAAVAKLERASASAGVTLVPVDDNPVDAAWLDQPARPASRILAHDLVFAGLSSTDKRASLAKKIADAGADAVLISAPPSIAWMFNIRGSDVARTPLPLGRAILYKDGRAILFVSPDKVDNALPAHLGDDVELRPEGDVSTVLGALGRNGACVAFDSTLAPAKYHNDLVAAGARLLELPDPCALPRATKNDAELNGTRAAHIRDGAAVTRFLYWLATSAQDGSVDEITAATTLEQFRRETGELVDLSFDSITGSGPNGAIVHYRVTTQTNRHLMPGELFLVDSGAQYKDGTTDITRTVAIGEPSAEMRDRFTRVLKGHIALATARFPAHTTGHQLDVLARRPLWEAGLDYDHGTGHGVGVFLGVHEGPQRIAKTVSPQALMPGMILSNEPGYYKTGAYGIRIENLIVVEPATPVEGGEREMFSFETITLAPICLDLVVGALLNEGERHWLNKYHARVRQTLSPLLPADVAAWLADVTRSI